MLHSLLDRMIGQLVLLEDMLEAEEDRQREEIGHIQEELSANEIALKNMEGERDSKKDYFSPSSSKKTYLKNSLRMKGAELSEELAELTEENKEQRKEKEEAACLKADLEEYLRRMEEAGEADDSGDGDDKVVIGREKVYNIISALEKSCELIDGKAKLCAGIAGQDARRVKPELERVIRETDRIKDSVKELDELLSEAYR